MKPRILMLYYSFTNQTRRIAETMGEVFRGLDCDVEECAIELIDKRYHIELPFRPVIRKLLGWLVPQLLGRTAAVRVPEEFLARDYDLICIGSPTWWLNPAMPIVSFLKSPAAGQLLNGRRFAVFTVCRKVWWNNMRHVKKMAKKQGGTFVDGAAFCFQGSDLQSALSFISYMKNDANLDRYCGVRIYEFGIPADGIDRARDFARELTAKLQSPAGASDQAST